MKNKIPWKKYLLRASIILPAVLVVLYIGWNNTDKGRLVKRLNGLVRSTASQQNDLKLQYISAPQMFVQFYYNTDGSLNKEVSYRYTGTDHSEVYTREYSYEDGVLGRKIVTIKTLDRRTGEYLDHVIVREVNRDGSCWRQEEYEGGRKISGATFDYNIKGQVRSISVWYESASTDTQSVTQYFDWDDDGRLIRHVLDNADGRTETTYTRNLRGDVTRIHWTHTAPDGMKTRGRQTYQWKYGYTRLLGEEKYELNKVADGEVRLDFQWWGDRLAVVWSQETDPSMWPNLLNEQPWLFVYGNPSQEWLTKWTR